MSGLRKSAGPTARQIELFQMLVLKRSMSAAARAMELHPETLRHAVDGFLRRARRYGL